MKWYPLCSSSVRWAQVYHLFFLSVACNVHIFSIFIKQRKAQEKTQKNKRKRNNTKCFICLLRARILLNCSPYYFLCCTLLLNSCFKLWGDGCAYCIALHNGRFSTFHSIGTNVWTPPILWPTKIDWNCAFPIFYSTYFIHSLAVYQEIKRISYSTEKRHKNFETNNAFFFLFPDLYLKNETIFSKYFFTGWLFVSCVWKKNESYIYIQINCLLEKYWFMCKIFDSLKLFITSSSINLWNASC